jgi:hypothetical protein
LCHAEAARHIVQRPSGGKSLGSSRAHDLRLTVKHLEVNMTAQTHSEGDRNVPVARIVYGSLLVLAVVALLIYALRFAFPGGNTGIEADPVESAPIGQPAPR